MRFPLYNDRIVRVDGVTSVIGSGRKNTSAQVLVNVFDVCVAERSNADLHEYQSLRLGGIASNQGDSLAIGDSQTTVALDELEFPPETHYWG